MSVEYVEGIGISAMNRRVLSYLRRATNPRRTSVLWWDVGEIALVAVGFLLYFIVRGAVIDRTGDALYHARRVVELQSLLGLWIEPAFQAWVVETRLVARVMNFAYFWFDFPLIIGAGLLLFWRSRSNYTLLRDALLISGGFALILYWTFPVAPPRYLTEWGFVDTLEQYSNLSYQAQSMRPFVNPFAAVPSLHVGWSALLAVVIFRATPRLIPRVTVVVLFVLQSLAVVATANHFLFDGVAGLLVCALAFGIALWLQRTGYPWLHHWIAEQERVLPPAGAGDDPLPGG